MLCWARDNTDNHAARSRGFSVCSMHAFFFLVVKAVANVGEHHAAQTTQTQNLYKIDC